MRQHYVWCVCVAWHAHTPNVMLPHVVTVRSVRTMKCVSTHKCTCSTHSTERPILLKALHEATFPLVLWNRVAFWDLRSCGLLGYPASGGSSLSTFRDNLSVTFTRDPWKWDRQIREDRIRQDTVLCCIKPQKSSFSFPSRRKPAIRHLWHFDNNKERLGKVSVQDDGVRHWQSCFVL